LAVTDWEGMEEGISLQWEELEEEVEVVVEVEDDGDDCEFG